MVFKNRIDIDTVGKIINILILIGVVIYGVHMFASDGSGSNDIDVSSSENTETTESEIYYVVSLSDYTYSLPEKVEKQSAGGDENLIDERTYICTESGDIVRSFAMETGEVSLEKAVEQIHDNKQASVKLYKTANDIEGYLCTLHSKDEKSEDCLTNEFYFMNQEKTTMCVIQIKYKNPEKLNVRNLILDSLLYVGSSKFDDREVYDGNTTSDSNYDYRDKYDQSKGSWPDGAREAYEQEQLDEIEKAYQEYVADQYNEDDNEPPAGAKVGKGRK